MNDSQQSVSRVAVVTGGGRGIGREYCIALADEGSTVVVADIDEGLARETARLVGERGGQAVPCTVDVSDPKSTLQLAEFVRSEFGRAHILVNNAAIYHSMRNDPQLEVDIEYWRKVFAVNLEGALLMTQALAPLMIEAGWGRVVNQASTAAYSGLGGAYAVSKLALIGLTQGFARELGPHGVTVNAIAPGLIYTEATLATVSETSQKDLTGRQSIAKQGEPGDLVAALRFFCGEDAGFTNGQVVVVDGFKTLRV